MRYLVMHKLDPQEVPNTPPEQRIIDEMGALIGDSVKSGVFLDGDGLQPASTRVRLRAAGGRVELERGPYAGQNELCQRLAQIRTADLEDAIAVAQRYAEALGDVELEIGPIVEAWDLGLMAKPSGLASARFLLLLKSNARSEAGLPFSAEQTAALTKLEADLSAAKILRATLALAPSRRAQRSKGRKGERTWMDGPFAESKELVSGFSVLELPSRAAALEWANRYADILGECEVDVRELD